MSEHWYNRQGEPCHKVPTKKGAKNPFRPTDVRDARTLGLLPSVTTILKVLDKPALNDWRVKEALRATMHIKPYPMEGEEDYIARALVEATKVVNSASDFGTRMHAAIDQYFLDGSSPKDLELLPYFDYFKAWADANVLKVISSESVFVGRGYAGTCDIKFLVRWPDGGTRLAIADYKTRRPNKSGASFAPYPENGMQLAAYLRADEMKPNGAQSCISIFINSETPEPPHAYYWSDEEIATYYEAFQNARNLWCILKKYNPS